MKTNVFDIADESIYYCLFRLHEINK